MFSSERWQLAGDWLFCRWPFIQKWLSEKDPTTFLPPGQVGGG
jgi:hypothetical protein